MKKVKFFLDTANLEEIKEAISWGCFSGVTTNPIILSKETSNYIEHVKKLLNLIPKEWDLSVEVKATDCDDMLIQAEELSKLDKRIRVKIPATEEGIKVVKQIVGKIPLNVTVVKSAGQAMLFQALTQLINPKDILVSIFCGRINHNGYDWRPIINDISKIDWPGDILAASIKSPYDISEAISNGANIITAPFDVYKMALNSPLVFEDVNKFNEPFDDKDFKII